MVNLKAVNGGKHRGEQSVVLRRSRPAVVVIALHAALHDLEHEFNIHRGTIDHGERVASERGGHVALGVALAASLLHDDGRRRRVEPSEQFEHAQPGLFRGRWREGNGIEREPEIDNRDVHRVGADGAFGFARGPNTQRVHAHGFEKRRQEVGPRLVLPTAPGEQQVQASAAIGRGRVAGRFTRRNRSKANLRTTRRRAGVRRGRGRPVVGGVPVGCRRVGSRPPVQLTKTQRRHAAHTDAEDGLETVGDTPTLSTGTSGQSGYVGDRGLRAQHHHRGDVFGKSDAEGRAQFGGVGAVKRGSKQGIQARMGRLRTVWRLPAGWLVRWMVPFRQMRRSRGSARRALCLVARRSTRANRNLPRSRNRVH